MIEQTKTNYELLLKQARALIQNETDKIANAANISALLFNELEQLNWVGFYFLKDNELVLGPFQGRTACVRIPIGKGVCGTAVAERKSMIVDDVEQFPSHIVCDINSKSELVVPLKQGDKIIGVLDIDSNVVKRFSEQDLAFFEQMAAIYVKNLS